jgi:hypothetical protein
LLCFARGLPPSDPIASLPDKKNESSNQPNDTKHPVLDVETQKSATLNQKPHCRRPVFRQAKHFCDGNVLFLYFERAGTILPMPDRSGAGCNSSLERDMWDEEVSSAKESFWLILYGDERPDMSR